MNTVLLTGVAGFIGFHTAKQLLDRGIEVLGVDNLNDYYDVRLKQYHLHQLENVPDFGFTTKIHLLAGGNGTQLDST